MNKELFQRTLSSLILIPIVLFFIIKGSIFFNFFIIVMLLISLYEWHFLSLKKVYYLPGFIFIILSFYSFFLLRHEGDYRIFLLILLTCIATDVGGYVFGKIFKGPKITKISPKKTYSGMMGSYLFAIISSFLLINNSNLIEGKTYEFTIELFFLVIIISTTSQIGDLIVSFFKRLSKIKDTGKLIPGHGGLLDRIDGLLFAMPIAYVILNFIILK